MVRQSESIAALASAMAKVQGEVENASKNAANPHFKSRYADLAEIINTVRPVLTKHGLSVMQFPGFSDGVATVETLVTHSSGEWVAATSATPVQKQDPQGVGSATTYLRRYSLAAVCAIAQEDDDGNAATGRKRDTAPDDLVNEVQRLWLHAAGLGLDAHNPEGMTLCDQAIRNRDKAKLEKAKAWLLQHIQEAEEAA